MPRPFQIGERDGRRCGPTAGPRSNATAVMNVLNNEDNEVAICFVGMEVDLLRICLTLEHQQI